MAYSPTIVCDCKSEYQDKRYGPGNRVFTPKGNGDKVCTICEKSKGSASSYKVKK